MKAQAKRNGFFAKGRVQIKVIILIDDEAI